MQKDAHLFEEVGKWVTSLPSNLLRKVMPAPKTVALKVFNEAGVGTHIDNNLFAVVEALARAGLLGPDAVNLEIDQRPQKFSGEQIGTVRRLGPLCGVDGCISLRHVKIHGCTRPFLSLTLLGWRCFRALAGLMAGLLGQTNGVGRLLSVVLRGVGDLFCVVHSARPSL